MKRIILFVMLSFYCVTNAQKYLPNLIPPSPNASSILKFADVPVSYHKGTSNINVPFIHEEIDGINIEASIQYDTRGIKVSENSSNIGAGWTLSTGGTISRQVRDRPDEYSNGYLTFNHVKNFQTSSSIRNNILTAQSNSLSSETTYDEYPDLYIFSFFGKTGKFIFDNFTKKPVLQNLDDLKIEVEFQANSYIIERIIITDEKGNKYYFGKAADNTSSYDTINSLSNQLVNDFTNTYNDLEAGYRNSWHLMEIVTSKNNTIKYKYNAENVTQYSKSETLVNNRPALLVQRRILTQNVISEIIFNANKIVFNYDGIFREDLQGSKALKNIILFDNNQNQIKKIELVSSYINGDPESTPQVLKYIDPNSHKRLFLNSVKVWDNNAINFQTYAFNYNTIALPSKHSSSIDYWGYYNGVKNRDNLLEGQNTRSVSALYNEAGILKKVTYPTGGSVDLEYENNEVITPSYFKDLLIPNLVNDSNFFHDVSEGIFKGSLFFNYGYPGTYERIININVPTNVSVGYFAYLGDNCTNIETSDCLTKVRLQNLETGELFVITNGSSYFPANAIKAGTYKIIISNLYFSPEDDLNFETNNFFVTLNWRELNNENAFYNNFIAGGKRIKTITSNSNGTLVKRTFGYNLESNVSSGKLIGLPDFFYRSKEINNLVFGLTNNSPVSSFNYGGDVGYSIVTEKVLDGNNNLKQSIQYYYTNFEDGGQFYKNYFHIADNMDWARGLNTQVLFKNATGQIVKKIENQYSIYNETSMPYLNYRKYDNQLTSNLPQSSNQLIDVGMKEIPTHYFYSKNLVTIPIYRFGDYKELNNTTPDLLNSNIYRIAFFTGGKVILKKTITEEFYNGSSLLTTSNYFYDNNNHYQLTREETSFSDGTTSKKLLNYAHEKGNQKLIDANMVGIPLETITIQNEKPLSKVETIYPTALPTAQTGSSLLPLSVQSTKVNTISLTTPPTGEVKDTEITFDKYDSKGNILQYTSKSGIPTTIIWGYNQTQPIAKIEGIGYDSLLATSGASALVNDAITKSNADKDRISEDALIIALNTLRNNSNLSGYQITTYTYDPLIGVTSITPPSGIMERYFYDTANRLEKVVDVNGNILKEYKYNYKQ